MASPEPAADDDPGLGDVAGELAVSTVDPRDLPHWPLTADQVPALLPKVIS